MEYCSSADGRHVRSDGRRPRINFGRAGKKRREPCPQIYPGGRAIHPGHGGTDVRAWCDGRDADYGACLLVTIFCRWWLSCCPTLRVRSFRHFRYS